MSDQPNLPTPEELDAFFGRLMDVEEELDAMSRRAFAVTNYEEEQEVTFEHIGSLVVFADDLRRHALHVRRLADKLERVAINELDPIRRDGRQMNVPQFDRWGHPNSKTGDVTARAVEAYFGKPLADV